MNYTVNYKDAKGHDHETIVEAPSASAALSLVLQNNHELGLHPNRITRVILEDR